MMVVEKVTRRDPYAPHCHGYPSRLANLAHVEPLGVVLDRAALAPRAVDRRVARHAELDTEGGRKGRREKEGEGGRRREA